MQIVDNNEHPGARAGQEVVSCQMLGHIKVMCKHCPRIPDIRYPRMSLVLMRMSLLQTFCVRMCILILLTTAVCTA